MSKATAAEGGPSGRGGHRPEVTRWLPVPLYGHGREGLRSVSECEHLDQQDGAKPVPLPTAS
jgi:hypothetical protein